MGTIFNYEARFTLMDPREPDYHLNIEPKNEDDNFKWVNHNPMRYINGISNRKIPHTSYMSPKSRGE